MSSVQQSFNEGKAQATAEAKADQVIDSARNAASTASEKAHEGSEKASGLLHQTGEQVKSMAQDAVDTVKNTLGIDKSSDTNSSSNN